MGLIYYQEELNFQLDVWILRSAVICNAEGSSGITGLQLWLGFFFPFTLSKLNAFSFLQKFSKYQNFGVRSNYN